MIKGVDVSGYQSATFDTTGLSFAFVKATEGTGYVNPTMAAQAAHARKAGLVVGFYHFLRPGNVLAQARYFVDHADSELGDILALDWEDTGNSSADKDAFLAEVKRLRPSRHKVVLYCNQDFWLHRDTSNNCGDGLWIANYTGFPGHTGVQHAWTFHQYAEHPLDLDAGNFASKDALRSWADREVA